MTRLEAMTKLAAMIDMLRNTPDHDCVNYYPALSIFTHRNDAAVDDIRAATTAYNHFDDRSNPRYKTADECVVVYVSDTYGKPADLLANRDVQLIEIGGGE